MSTIKDILQKYSTEQQKTASAAPAAVAGAPAVSEEDNPIKIARDLGVRDSENLMKVAALVGDVIGERAVAKIAESFGYDPEVMKVASIQDLLFDSIIKVAEQVTGTTVSAASATEHAENLQISESAAHHANAAATAAADAVQSLQQGDEHTCAQMMASATSHLQSAKQFAARVGIPEVHNHVNEAAQIVGEAADVVGQAAGASA
jgi:hypothetical protein